MPDELESQLRDVLRERAGYAPPPTAVSQRLLADARGRAVRSARPAWLLPAIAACVVLLIAGGTVGGIALVRHLSKGAVPAAPTHVVPPLPAPTRPTAATSSAAGPSNPSAAQTGSGSNPGQLPVGPVGGPVPAGMTISDLTFVSTELGWGLGTAPCTTAPCTSLVRTRDGGRSWVGIRPPVVGLVGAGPCSTPCVQHVRFATPLVGYLFGPSVLYLTTDGGDTWTRQSGGAYALEVSGGTVLRVVGEQPNCTPGCTYDVLRSTVGSASWQRVLSTPGLGFTTGVDLVHAGRTAVVQVYGHPAGGGQAAHSSMFVSRDDGAAWTSRGEPCPQVGGEVDAAALTSAADGSLAVLCRLRAAGSDFVAVSRDQAATFTGGKTLTNLQTTVGAASASSLLLVGMIRDRQVLVRSTDGGRNWNVVVQDGRPVGSQAAFDGFLGFESQTVGRWVGRGDPATVWTTRDAGATWARYTFR